MALAVFALAALQPLCPGRAAGADTVVCSSGAVPRQAIRLGGPRDEPSQPDLLVAGPCRAPAGTYYYGNVNVVRDGSVTFEETPYAATHFWASAIIVENAGALLAGSADAPFGALGGTMTIHLYGADKSAGHPDQIAGQGAPCRTAIDARRDIGPCGIPLSLWTSHAVSYEPLPGDGAAGRGPGYFGYKVLGVSYGGTLALFGAKGVGADAGRDAGGLGWVPLAAGAAVDAGATRLVLDRAVQGNWTPGDQAVLTPTDGQPEHAEEIVIDGINGASLVFHRTDCAADKADAGCPGLQWPHDAGSGGTESGAAVALLTRSIRIVSEGDAPGETFDQAAARDLRYAFGGHTIARQGFERFQMQGVELYRLGQESRRGHYPINFPATGAMPVATFVKDTVLRDTMTYWYELHAIAGVTLQRDVTYGSLGHDTYLAAYTFDAAEGRRE